MKKINRRYGILLKCNEEDDIGYVGKIVCIRPSVIMGGFIAIDTSGIEKIFRYLFRVKVNDLDKYIKTTKFLDFISCQNLK